MLKDYFNKFHSPKVKIISLEKFFKIKIDSDLFLSGKIDRVDLLPKNQIEIIDYKTGKKPDDKQLKKNFQLSIYAMAATDRGLFNKKLSEINLTFYFLQDMEKITLKRTSTDLKTVKEQIADTVSEIQKNEFLPRVGRWCDFCSFRIICEAWQ